MQEKSATDATNAALKAHGQQQTDQVRLPAVQLAGSQDRQHLQCAAYTQRAASYMSFQSSTMMQVQHSNDNAPLTIALVRLLWRCMVTLPNVAQQPEVNAFGMHVRQRYKNWGCGVIGHPRGCDTPVLQCRKLQYVARASAR